MNRIELHPLFQQHETRAYCAAHGIGVESYSSSMQAGEALGQPVIVDLAEQYGKTPAQIISAAVVSYGFV